MLIIASLLTLVFSNRNSTKSFLEMSRFCCFIFSIPFCINEGENNAKMWPVVNYKGLPGRITNNEEMFSNASKSKFLFENMSGFITIPQYHKKLKKFDIAIFALIFVYL